MYHPRSLGIRHRNPGHVPEEKSSESKDYFQGRRVNDWKFLQWKKGWVIITDLAIIVVVIKNM